MEAMWTPFRSRVTLAAVLVVAGLSSACSGLRALSRDAVNAERTGEPAPALAGGAWTGAVPDLEGRWRLVVFLRPT